MYIYMYVCMYVYMYIFSYVCSMYAYVRKNGNGIRTTSSHEDISMSGISSVHYIFVAVCSSVLQRVAGRCSVLQFSVLQCVVDRIKTSPYCKSKEYSTFESREIPQHVTCSFRDLRQTRVWCILAFASFRSQQILEDLKSILHFSFEGVSCLLQYNPTS